MTRKSHLLFVCVGCANILIGTCMFGQKPSPTPSDAPPDVNALVKKMASEYMKGFPFPSDADAKACFAARKQELESLVLSVTRDADIEFVDADWAASGSAAQDPTHIACAKLLKKIWAQFLKHNGSRVEIYFWGSGCAICHDSYKGFMYVGDSSLDMPQDSKMCLSVKDRSLPRGRYAPVEDGTYLVPLSEHWYIIRWEQG